MHATSFHSVGYMPLIRFHGAQPSCAIWNLAGTFSPILDNIPVIACVFNNKQWGAEKKNQVDYYDDRYVGADIEGPQFAQVAEAMGAVGITVDKAEDLPGAYKQALEAKKPVVMDIMVDGTMLAPPFRKDALKMPTRYLDKYKHLDYDVWGEN